MRLAGTKERDLRKFEALTAKCNVCGNSGKKGTWRFRWFHLVGIPFFPIGRTITSTCQHCGAEAVGPEHSHEELQDIKPFAGTGRPPLYLFAGTVLMIVSIVYGIRHSNAQNEAERALLSVPLANDQYLIKNTELHSAPYQLFWVTRTGGGGVYGYPSAASHASASGCYQDVSTQRTLETSYWNRSQPVGYSSTELLQLHTEGLLQEIWRVEGSEAFTTPQKGDTYILYPATGNAGKYRMYRVVDVYSDSLYGRFAREDYEEYVDFKRDQQTGRINGDDYWESQMQPIAREQILAWQRAGAIAVTGAE